MKATTTNGAEQSACHPFDAVLRLALNREGCTNPKDLSTRELWRIVYRHFREDARALYAVQKQLIAFRGFGPKDSRFVGPDPLYVDADGNPHYAH